MWFLRDICQWGRPLSLRIVPTHTVDVAIGVAVSCVVHACLMQLCIYALQSVHTLWHVPAADVSGA